MSDPVYDAFLETAAEDVLAVNAASDILQLTPDPAAGRLPHTYNGWLQEVEHLDRAGDGTAYVSAATVGFTIHFPAEYCRSTGADLQFRVVRLHFPLLHPNTKGGMVCLGPHFRPGTRLRPLVHQIYGIISGRIFATDHAFDAEACMYYLRHLDQVRALRARPLWRRRVAGRVRVEGAAGVLPKDVEQAHG
ncbi:MAG: hypothetical protein ACE5I7_14875 [Candidatus Binatia bacterium]